MQVLAFFTLSLAAIGCVKGWFCIDQPAAEDLNMACACTAGEFADCADIKAALPATGSGVYYVMVPGETEARQVRCDMEDDGGAWTVILRRQDGSVDFYQNWDTYRNGFGDPNGEYWLGLEAMYQLTSAKTYEIKVELEDWEGRHAQTYHSSFAVGPESTKYQLTLGAVRPGDGGPEDAGDGLSEGNGRRFTTLDSDNDNYGAGNCAERHHGGFWYNMCQTVHPTAKYYVGGTYEASMNDGIQWRTWNPDSVTQTQLGYYSMKTLQFKIRPMGN
jgi:hypothetical protein